MRRIDARLDTEKLLGWQKGASAESLVPTSKVGDGGKPLVGVGGKPDIATSKVGGGGKPSIPTSKVGIGGKPTGTATL